LKIVVAIAVFAAYFVLVVLYGLLMPQRVQLFFRDRQTMLGGIMLAICIAVALIAVSVFS
jgi:putative Mn2+ efflux pump MntP